MFLKVMGHGRNLRILFDKEIEVVETLLDSIDLQTVRYNLAEQNHKNVLHIVLDKELVVVVPCNVYDIYIENDYGNTLDRLGKR